MRANVAFLHLPEVISCAHNLMLTHIKLQTKRKLSATLYSRSVFDQFPGISNCLQVQDGGFALSASRTPPQSNAPENPKTPPKSGVDTWQALSAAQAPTFGSVGTRWSSQSLAHDSTRISWPDKWSTAPCRKRGMRLAHVLSAVPPPPSVHRCVFMQGPCVGWHLRVHFAACVNDATSLWL